MVYVIEISRKRCSPDLLGSIGERVKELLKVVEIQTSDSTLLAKLLLQTSGNSNSSLARVVQAVEEHGGRIIAPVYSGVVFKAPLHGTIIELARKSGMEIIEIKISGRVLFLYLASADERTFLHFLEAAKREGFSIGIAGIYDEFLEHSDRTALRRYTAKIVFEHIGMAAREKWT